MAQLLVVLGSSGNTLDFMDVLDAINAAAPRWALIGLLDDGLPTGPNALGVKTLGRLDAAAALAAPGGPLADAMFLNTIGSPASHAARPGIVARTGLAPERFATLTHPLAAVSPRAALGRGCCVNAGASIAGRVTVSDHAWIGPGCILGHDAVLEPHAVMAPGSIISGSVRLGAACYLGTGAVVRQGVRIGAEALVGMGAVVLRDVPAGTMVVGNPARTFRHGR